MSKKHPCPCCGNLTIEIPGFYEICSVCGWEDDPAQEDDSNDPDGANGISLSEARDIYRRKQKAQA